MQANICCLSREEEECLNFLDNTIGSLDESSLFHKNLALGSIRSREDTVDLLTNAVQQNDGADVAAVFTSTKQPSEAEPVEHNLSDSSFQQSSEGSLTSAFENNRTTHPAQQQQRVMDTQLFGPGSMPGANAEALTVSTMIENRSQISPDELSLQNKEEAGDSSDEQGQGSESDWPSHSPAENIHSPSDPKELHICGAGRIPGRIGPAQTKNFNTIMKAGVNVQKRRAVMLDLLNHHNNNNNNSNSNDSDSGLGLSPRDQNLFVPSFSTSVPFTEQPFVIKGDVRSFERSEFRDERDSNSVSQPPSRSGSLVEAPAKMWPISRSCSERRIKLNGKTIAKYPSFEDEIKKSVCPLQKPVSQQITIVGPGHWKIIAPKS